MLQDPLKGWALFSEGWKLPGSEDTYDISSLYKVEREEGDMDPADYLDKVFYKERWINHEGLEQRLIVTFSLKYRVYQRKIRGRQVERARKLIKKNPGALKKPRQNDYKRFIVKKSVGAEGQEAKKETFDIDDGVISREEIYDGFYAVCTNLTDDVSEIVKINRRRWEIEESFRIMKHEFKARPVYLQKDDRIKAHFTTCFLSLVLFRYLEKLLRQQYTCDEIIDTLRDMNFLKSHGEGYIPAYMRTDLTDDLHTAFGFRTDYEIVTNRQMKAICKIAKKL
jgi:transposase